MTGQMRGAGIRVTGVDGVVVDRLARTITFTNKVLAGLVDATQTGTASGTLTFPANAVTNACG